MPEAVMQYVWPFLVACFAIAALQVAMKLLVLAIVAGLLLSAIWRPAETFTLLAFLTYASLLGRFPLWTVLGTIVVLGVAHLMSLRNR
jgi:hypothetical protein